MFEFEDVERPLAKIKVVGVGGGGGNAINSMVAANLYGVEFISVNTDSQHLESSLAAMKVQVGSQITKGLGAGSNPVIGRQAALEDRDALAGCIEGADLVFITAGMGGGTGTGAAPVIANIARELGILTVGVVTKPFYYEGRKRAMNAEEGLRELRKYADTLIVIPNDRINLVVERGTPLLKSFAIVNDVLRQAVQGISDVILKPGLINLDFADVKAIMEGAGRAVIGLGSASGEGGAVEAAKKAISNPLLESSSIEGARRILINVTAGLHMSIDDLNAIGSLIYDSVHDGYDVAHDDRNIIVGAVIDADIDDEYRVTVIATGLEETVEKADLPEVRKWTPRAEPRGLKASKRILAKSFETRADEVRETTPPAEEEKPQIEPDVNNSSMPAEDLYDIPTFLRKRV
jgi:cell division protein FtsZ